jgi:hypothetical protein
MSLHAKTADINSMNAGSIIVNMSGDSAGTGAKFRWTPSSSMASADARAFRTTEECSTLDPTHVKYCRCKQPKEAYGAVELMERIWPSGFKHSENNTRPLLPVQVQAAEEVISSDCNFMWL